MIVAVIGVILTGCEALDTNQSDALEASGLVEVVEVAIAPELPGRVMEVMVEEGDEVREGAPLFELGGEMLEAQHRQARAAHEAAQASLIAANAAVEAARAVLETSEVGVEVARIQVDLALAQARAEDQAARTESWDQDVPNEFSMPAWYFEKHEQIEAARLELEAALEALERERDNFEQTVEGLDNAEIREAEERLSEAQAAFLVAEALTERDIDVNERAVIDDFVDTIYEAAVAELEDAHKDYEKLLSDKTGEDVLEARARLAVMQERYDTARDQLDELLTGEFDLRVQAARASLEQVRASAGQARAALAQAEANVVQMEKAVAQTSAAVEAIEVQLKKLTIYAPVAGVVLTRNVEPGEVVQAGVSALTLGRMDAMTITVYIPENRYGQVQLGDLAQVRVDSFEGKQFEARVIRIADEAEYTPRNVQTEEDRQTTVYAIELSVKDPQGLLKPGMPADVVFEE
jgi:multidrug resistance efflux pump